MATEAPRLVRDAGRAAMRRTSKPRQREATPTAAPARPRGSKRPAGPLDIVIGRRIGERRQAVELSRLQLGSLSGVTHQQIYKYEHGIDKISIGRLFVLAQALHTPIASFFDGVGDTRPQPSDVPTEPPLELGPDAIELVRLYDAIGGARLKRALLKFLQGLGGTRRRRRAPKRGSKQRPRARASP